jgi:hypothetical protein
MDRYHARNGLDEFEAFLYSASHQYALCSYSILHSMDSTVP